ncbi:hypothetical protein BKA66DRAFT_470158 [Pyrenochaeta sp. MPI-SDFR-AT-0127]|nr:hypothetical protein BKA66DRAFT_470158 [Pyrenochaeta sp. MPI-SDFR-AT-0127]
MYRVPCCSFLSLCSFLSTDTLSLTLFCNCCLYVLSLITLHSLNTTTLLQHPFAFVALILVCKSPEVRPFPIQYTSQYNINVNEKRNAFLDTNIHHGFRTGYLNSPQAAGQRLVPSPIDTSGLRPASLQNAVHNTPRRPAAVHRPRHITPVLELDCCVVHTAATWQ